MAKKTNTETQEVKKTQQVTEEQPKETPQEKPKDDRILYAGPTIINERFYLRKGQIFTEIPRYAPEELKPFFIPLSDYSPEKEKELEKLRQKYLKEQAKKNRGGK